MDEVDLVRRLAPDVAGPDAGRKHQARLALTAITARRRQRFGWVVAPPWRVGLLAGVAALVAIGFARPLLLPLAPPDPAAAAALQEAATVAAGAEPLEIGGGYVYTKTDALWPFMSDRFSYLRPLLRESWVAADGSGRIRETTEEPIFLSEADREAFTEGGYTVYAIYEDFGPGGLLAADLIPNLFGVRTLPTDVDELRDMLGRHAGQGQRWPIEASMFVTIGDLLRDPFTPPEARAALYEVAATLPGIELLGEQRDHAGRTGVAVALADRGLREIIIFDPATSTLLEERSELLVASGVTWSRSTYLETKVVAELPAE